MLPNLQIGRQNGGKELVNSVSKRQKESLCLKEGLEDRHLEVP
jgi:hypothetical protein